MSKKEILIYLAIPFFLVNYSTLFITPENQKVENQTKVKLRIPVIENTLRDIKKA